MVNTYSAGIATAYGAAVRGGYTGTYEEWCALMADYAAVGEEAAQSAQAAQASAENAATSESNAAASVGEATTQATAAATSATNAAQSATDASGSASAASTSAANAADSATAAAGSASAAATSATNAAASEAAAAGSATTAAQELGKVQAEGEAQTAAITAEGERVLDSIPADYTALSDEVGDLKSHLVTDYQGFDETYSSSGTVDSPFEFLQGKTYRFSLIAPSGAAAINIYNEVGGSSVESVGTLNAGSYIDYTVQTGGNCVHFYHGSAGRVTIENIDSLIYKSIEYKDNEIKTLFDYYSTMKPTIPTFEGGTFNPSTGQPISTTTRARTVDYFKIDPVTSFVEVTGIEAYPNSTHISILFYDSNQSFLGETGWLTGVNVGITKRYKITNQNAAYIKLNTRSSNSVTITQEIIDQLNAGAIKVFNRAEDSETTKLGELVSYNDVKINAISHRGWHADPENTLIAFKDSKKHGFDFVEGDVRFTSDGVAVMLHDASINRTARNADGTALPSTVNIADITYAQAQTYDFGVYKGSQFAGAKIPTFKEFITLCKNIGVTPYIELKMEYGTAASVITQLVDIVKQCGMLNNVVWVGSIASVLQAVPNYYSKAKCGLFVETITQERITVCGDLKTPSNEVFISANYSNVTDELVNLCITNNIPLEIFVCDSASYIESMNPYITGVLSNTLDARKVLYDENI